MNNLKKIILFLSLICLLTTPFSIFSYEEDNISSSDISVETIPEYPKPYQDTTIKLTSYATDLNKSMIEWRTGGQIVLSGYGKNNYTLTTKGSGEPIIVDIIIYPANSVGVITKKILINPSEIDILWEAVDSYTPPFYKGKAFPASSSSIKTVAIPNTKSNKNNVVYNWKINDNSSGISGNNQDYFTFKNNELDMKTKITVNASSVDSKYNSVGEIEVPIINPKIVFYEKDPVEGINYSKAITNNFSMDKNKEEMTLVAEPYFFSLNSNENFSYEWLINGQKTENPNNTEITIKPTSRDGYATINLIIENINALFQKASGLIKINL